MPPADRYEAREALVEAFRRISLSVSADMIQSSAERAADLILALAAPSEPHCPSESPDGDWDCELPRGHVNDHRHTDAGGGTVHWTNRSEPTAAAEGLIAVPLLPTNAADEALVDGLMRRADRVQKRPLATAAPVAAPSPSGQEGKPVDEQPCADCGGEWSHATDMDCVVSLRTRLTASAAECERLSASYRGLDMQFQRLGESFAAMKADRDAARQQLGEREAMLREVHRIGINLGAALRLAVTTEYKAERSEALEEWEQYVLSSASSASSASPAPAAPSAAKAKATGMERQTPSKHGLVMGVCPHGVVLAVDCPKCEP